MSGVEILRAIQSVNTPLLDALFGFVTNLHHETFYILVLPLIYWLYDKRFGRYIFSVFALGFWSNDLLKEIFDTSRPSAEDVRVIFAETGGGPAFPSGHSQTPLIFWGALALQFRRPWFSWLAGIVVFLIGFSRLYLGVHWPLDMIGGWAIGAVILVLIYWSRTFWAGEGQSLGFRLLLAVILPAITLGSTWLVSSHGVDPLVWTMAGVYAGLLTGSALEEAYVGFEPGRGTWLQQAMKLLVGLVLVLAVKEGFKLFLPDTAIGDMIRYFFVALVATLGAPWLFHRFITPPPKISSVRG